MAASQSHAPTSKGSAPRWIAIITAIFFLAGLAILGKAVSVVIDRRHEIAAATRADGVVIDLIASHDSESETYHPRVRFVTANGEVVEFTGSVGSDPPGFDIGERVAVLYDPANPNDARIDAFFQLWFAPLMLGILGTLFTAAGGGLTIGLLRAGNKLSRPILASPAAQSVPPPRPASAVERRPRD